MPRNFQRNFRNNQLSDSDWHTIPVKNFLGKKEIVYGWGAYFGKSLILDFLKKQKVWGNQRVHPKIKLVGKEGKNLKTNFIISIVRVSLIFS